MTTLTTESTVSPSPRPPIARTAWMIGGGLAIAAAGVAAGMAWRPAPNEATPPTSMESSKASLANNQAIVEPGRDAEGKPEADAKPATNAKPAAQKPAATRRTPTPSPSSHAGNDTTPLNTRPAAVCSTCGVVEGVREVKVKGEGSGIGAVAGGVLGAAVGNQVGKGNGRKAMTVLGAVGGGFAGHEIEKQARSETVYEVRVRMDDGSVRTFTRKTAPAPGARVTVEGNTLHTTRAPSGDAQMMRTSSGA